MAVITIITMLTALLFPVFVSAKRSAKSITCITNLHQIGVGTELYMSDHDDHYPVLVNWFERSNSVRLGRPPDISPDEFPSPKDVMKTYTKDERIFICSLDRGADIGGSKYYPYFYSFNGSVSYLFAELFDGQTASTWKDPAKAAWATDGHPSWHTAAFNETDFDSYKVNAIFYDWHAATKKGNAPTFLE